MRELLLRDKILYEQLDYNSDTNTPFLLAPVEIDGMRLKGSIKTTTSENGDSTTSSIVYRTGIKITVGSKLDGHTVMDSVKINSFGKYEHYLNYCK